MTLWQAIALGLLQGLTEFLPVSSSGHLVIVPYLLKWPDPGLLLDTMLHVGTLLAILVSFADDLWRLIKAAWTSIRFRSLEDPDARIAWNLVLATIPTAVIGYLLEDWFEQLFGSPTAVAIFLIGTALLLLLAEALGKRTRPLTAMSWFEALLIGLAQSLAIAPGLSRSGATISMGMFLGFRRDDSARFGFLLAVPIIAGNGAYQVLKIVTGEAASTTPLGAVIAGTLVAAVAGYFAIAGLLALVRRRSLWPFAVYCALLGVLVLSGVL